MKPPHWTMVYWRAKNALEWRFGFCTHLSGGLVRMGHWNGDETGGTIVDPADIDWKLYERR